MIIFINITKLDTKTIKEYVELLSSKEYNPREIGSESNENLIKYLEEDFKQLELETVFDESYLHGFGEGDRGEKLYNNVIGKMSGKNNKIAIVITAHFDAYESAYDNGTGVAVLMDVATEMAKRENIPYVDIIFALVNGEEKAMLGSKALIEDLKDIYDNMYNVNIDCVGLKELGPLALKNLSSVDKSENLYHSVKQSLYKNDVEWIDEACSIVALYARKENTGISDYAFFESNKYPNINISQYGISTEYAGDKEIDTGDIDIKELKKLSNGLVDFLTSFIS